MSSVRWRAVLAASLMLGGVLFAYLGRPTVYLSDQIGKPNLESLFPTQFGTWQLDASRPIILPAPDVQANLDAIYNQVLSRSYVNQAGQRIMLSVAYGGDQYDGTGVHRPESCYPAQGFAITSSEKGVQQLAQGSLDVRKLVAKLGARNEPITYWVVVGNRVATSGVEQKLAQVRYGLRGVIADGMLVRVSSIDSDKAQAHAIQAGFIAEMAAAMPSDARARVFGEMAL
jgi:EpsI family protein